MFPLWLLVFSACVWVSVDTARRGNIFNKNQNKPSCYDKIVHILFQTKLIIHWICRLINRFVHCQLNQNKTKQIRKDSTKDILTNVYDQYASINISSSGQTYWSILHLLVIFTIQNPCQSIEAMTCVRMFVSAVHHLQLQ